MRLRQLLLEMGVLVERNTFSQVARVLAGQDPRVSSYAIITAWNPYSEEHGSLENDEFQQALERDVRSMGLGYVRDVKGMFSKNPESSIFIPNISQKDAVALGMKYHQTSVIFGEKDEASGQMVHKYIERGEVTVTRKTFDQLAKDVKDNYSIVRGRKFIVPYFDPQRSGLEVRGGKIVPGKPDVNRPLSAQAEEDAKRRKEKWLQGFAPLTNPKGRKVWVYKQNVNKYLKLGYKKEEDNVTQAA